MAKKNTDPIKKFFLLSGLFFCLLSLASHHAFSQGLADVDPPSPEDVTPETEIKMTSPTNTMHGTRGIFQTSSAEAMGEGRLVFSILGTWYEQQKTFVGVPEKSSQIFSGILSAAYGISPQFDLFATGSGFGSVDYKSPEASGPGMIGAGLQGTLPFNPSIPVRMGGQVGVFQGLSNNPIDSNFADGYNYFETRTGLDFMAKLIQTLVYGSEDLAFKLHFNEAVVTSAESGTDPLLLLGVGSQFNLFNAVAAVELKSRTRVNDISVMDDPLWVTPSVQFRTAYNMNITLGGDISLSQDRSEEALRALEPYRLFAGLAFTFDTKYSDRKAAQDEARREAMEKKQLRETNTTMAENMMEQARQDSLARLEHQANTDSLKAAMQDRAQSDSLQMANRAREDSIALAATRQSLEEEKAKRSEAEKQLLSTGLLIMDAVYFETGKADISINSKPYLNIIAKMLLKYPKLNIEVAGHTDDVGADEYNRDLSQSRAQSVVTYMAEVAPDLRSHLTAKGYGETQPKSDNKTAEGRKLNRRTELQVLNKEALKEYN